ncbi:MAG: FG-GAP-like repeat-containing protein, partial [Planctomycetota bacterium]
MVRIESPSGAQIRRVNCGSGFMSSDEPVVYFGLGEDDHAERLVITWPDGAVQELAGLEADRDYTIAKRNVSSERPTAPAAEQSVTPAQPAEPLFARVSETIDVRHQETPFDDFADQPLLPAKLSQLGPGLAMSDVNNDGAQDLYLGGAAGQPGRLLLGEPDGGFRPVEIADFVADQAHEDMGCLFFDADSDGDFDLYVVSGSVEFGEGDAALRDRLYLNEVASNESGVAFQRAVDHVPDLRDSGSVVAGADFDRDGDVDLFVGGRVVPGRYPVAPQSRLLRNDEGRFVDATGDAAAGLKSPGMVTSAIWSDFDNDDWIDLVVTLDYGPIMLFKNEAGRLVDATIEAGLSGRSGWWNSIAARDVDLDGDVDFAVTNLGLNTKYHPSPAKPQLLYYGDFEGDGSFRLVEAKTGSSGILPVRGRSCSSNAMPFIKEKFGTYHAFASASLVDIYTEPCLDESLQLEVNTAEYGLLLNDGHGRFEFRALPRIAQAAPGFGIQFLHANDDAYPDLFIAQNFYTPQRETGRMNGGLGTLLLGSEGGNFSAVPANESGIVLPSDATGA